METIVFVGAGSMAEAILAGLVNQQVLPAEKIFVMNKADEARLKQLHTKYGVSIVCPERKILTEADLVILATKPHDITKAMADIAHLLKPNCAALSVIAGTPIAKLEEGLGKRPIARSMPNTSATIGLSATGVAFNTAVDETLQKTFIQLLGSIGLVEVVEEEDLHAVTALSGSGPAYIYYLVEALEAAAVKEGLSKELARALILQTLTGATEMMKQTQLEPDVLRENVTSPNGTTAAGLQSLYDGNFKELIHQCIESAKNRSQQLSQ